MQQAITSPLPLTIGLDLGSRSTQYAVLDQNGSLSGERKVATTPRALEALFFRFPGARIVMEASTATRWINNLAKKHGHEVIVANPRNIPVITASVRKCDRNDARLLAEFGQMKPHLLSPVILREDHYQEVRTLLVARQQVVKQRTALVTLVRAEVKVLGASLPSCETRCFASKCRPLIPEALQQSLGPILDIIQSLSETISAYDKDIERISLTDFPETEVLRQVHGVGFLVALAFVVTIGDPQRFGRSRAVGAYIGLVPRKNQSGNSDPALSITKCGDRYLRTLLVSAATRILGPFGVDSDLRRFGERIKVNGGPRAKAKARIAVARKLAVLLHQLLRTHADYEPLRNSPEVQELAEAASA